MQTTIAFVGGGNMAASLIGGLLASGHPKDGLRVVEPQSERAQWLRSSFGIAVAERSAEVIPGSAAVVLAVKPQAMRHVLRELQPDAGATVISIAAGVKLSTIASALGSQLNYVRTMPNTPALYGAGITGLYAPPGSPASARQIAEKILSAGGATVWLTREEELDAVTALSGSGPAYYFLLTEILRESGEALGLSRETAAALAKQTCIGTGRMIAESNESVETLRAQVTSKGGTTEAAIAHLESAGLRTIFRDALRKASERAAEMGRALD